MKKLNHLSLQAIIFLFPFRILFSQNIQLDYSNIEYALADNISLTLDVYLPSDVTAPYPVIVWVHGGAWLTSSKENLECLFLIKSGYAIVSINYRLSYQAVFPAQIYDCKSAVRWVRANAYKYNFDSNRIGVFGSSAGGHLVALMGTTNGSAFHEGTVGGNTQYSSSVQAVCDWYGPADFITTCYIRDVDVCIPLSPVWKLLGGSVSGHLDLAKLASPVYQVTKDDPPFLIMHGTLDPIVPIEQSVELDSVLRKNDVPVIFKRIVGAGHGGGGFDSDSAKNTVINFFNQYLSPTITNVKFEPVSSKDFELYQNYPNPFNPTTTIKFNLSQNIFVSLCVYNTLGQKIVKLVNQELSAGTHSVDFDATELPNGIYFYKIQTGNFIQTKKMILLK